MAQIDRQLDKTSGAEEKDWGWKKKGGNHQPRHGNWQ